MSKKHTDRKKLDELYMQDKKENYIKFLSLLIASNINAWYFRYHNKDDLSYQIVVREAKEAFMLSTEDCALVHNNIIDILEKQYNLKIVSYNKLKVEKIFKK